MGIISDLFGLSKPATPAPPSMISIMPPLAIKAIEYGKLPKLATKSLILDKGEYCRYVDKACLVTEKTITRYQGSHSGYSVRIIKGVTYRTGKSRTNPIKDRIPEYTPGYLYITDSRIVFVAKENGFEKTLKSFIAITSYSDAVGLQFSGKTYNFLLPTPQLVLAVLQMVI